MSNNTDTETCVVSMKPRLATKSPLQLIEAHTLCNDYCKCVSLLPYFCGSLLLRKSPFRFTETTIHNCFIIAKFSEKKLLIESFF